MDPEDNNNSISQPWGDDIIEYLAVYLMREAATLVALEEHQSIARDLLPSAVLERVATGVSSHLLHDVTDREPLLLGHLLEDADLVAALADFLPEVVDVGDPLGVRAVFP